MRRFLFRIAYQRHYRPDNGHRLITLLQSNTRLSQILNLGLNGAWQIRRRLKAISRTEKPVVSLPVLQTPSGEGERAPTSSGVPCDRPAREVFPRHVVLVAELSIPQCRKYRVDQKIDMLHHLGYQTTCCNWTDTELCLSALQEAGHLIFYRVPAFESFWRINAEARRLGLRVGYDIDDLVFSKPDLLANKSLDSLSAEERWGVLHGAELYRDALCACDYGLASTAVIAARMRSVGIARVTVVENAIDDSLLRLAESPHLQRSGSGPCEPLVTIGYGSGTKTHDADFAVAAEGLRRILQDYPQVRLVIYGLLDTRDYFAGLEDRVWRVGLLASQDYYEALSRFDINLAPLEVSVFNDAKSNIKWTEASLFGVPTVCSPADAFRTAVDEDRTGYFAESPDAWYAALSRLVESPDLRRTLGAAARAAVLDRYHWQQVAERQLSGPFPAAAPGSGKFRVLFANLLFSPQSFGGATIVVEQLAKRFACRDDTEVLVFCATHDPALMPLAVRRYEVGPIQVIQVRLPPLSSADEEFEHPQVEAVFSRLVRNWQPDVVHLHAVQNMGGSGLIECCAERAIPCVVTLHDPWWLCARQFMIRPDRRACAQERVQLPVCAECTGDPARTHRRSNRLRQRLSKAALLLTPSRFQQDFYTKNGPWPVEIRVNKNGIVPPRRERHRTPDPVLNFGYLGGMAVHKGYFLLKEIFDALPGTDWTLSLVDIEARLGATALAEDRWQRQDRIRLLPPFDQDGLDDFYDRIDVLLLPSQCRESFALTVREAMVRDVWVITTDSGGAAEDIVEGINGNVVPMDQPDAFRHAVLAAISRKENLWSYRNPHKAAIRTVDQQAAELHEWLRQTRTR